MGAAEEESASPGVLPGGEKWKSLSLTKKKIHLSHILQEGGKLLHGSAVVFLQPWGSRAQ